MSWGHPEALLLLFLLPALWIAWRLRRPVEKTLPYADLTWLPPAHSWRTWLAPRVPLAGTLAALACVVVALAQPRWPIAASRVEEAARAFMLVLDVSGSMGERDFGPRKQTRLAAAKTIAETMCAARPQDAIGLITFSSLPETVAPPTLDRTAVFNLLAAAKPSAAVPDNTTNLGDALAVALDRLRGFSGPDRVVVVISDGEHNVDRDEVGPVLQPVQAGRLAQALGIRIYSLFLSGSTKAAEHAERQRQAAQMFDELTAATGGQAFVANDETGLEQLLAALAATEPMTLPGFFHQRYQELRPWFLFAALATLVTANLLARGWLRVLPEGGGA